MFSPDVFIAFFVVWVELTDRSGTDGSSRALVSAAKSYLGSFPRMMSRSNAGRPALMSVLSQRAATNAGRAKADRTNANV